MTIAAPPKPPPVQPDPEALIEEARRRTRRRRLKYAAAGLGALLIGGGIYAGLEATDGSPAVQAVPPGFHLVKAGGPVSYAVLRYLPSRYRTLDLKTGKTGAAEHTSEIWWDPTTGLSRTVGRIGSQRFGAFVRDQCLGPRLCPPPDPWFLAKRGLRWKPAACCGVIAGTGEYDGRHVRWVESTSSGRRQTRDVERVGFDVRTHEPLVQQQFFGRNKAHLIGGYEISHSKTLDPQDVSFVVPNRGADRNYPSALKVVRARGFEAARDALGTAPLWLGTTFAGKHLRKVESGIDSLTTEKGQLLSRVPFVRVDYGRFTLEEYSVSRRPFGFLSGPAAGTALLEERGSMTLVRNGVLVLVTPTNGTFRPGAQQARALRPVPTT